MKKIKILFLVVLGVFIIGMFIPQNLKMPVQGATTADFNQQSYWAYPWGSSIVHKGVDIFARKGTDVHSSTIGLVLLTGELGKGGKVVLILGPKWRLHYYAHLDKITTSPFAVVTHNSKIGTVGNTGNAATTPSHLHYSIGTVLPYVNRMDKSPLGWQKAFYLNPIDYLNE